MKLHRDTIRWSAFGLLLSSSLGLRAFGPSSNALAQVGTQGLGRPVFPRPSLLTPRINVLEVDVWKRSLDDGLLSPVANVPIVRHELIGSRHFSPDIYRQQVETLRTTYTRQRDVLMYFGGLPSKGVRHGLNFNGWSIEDLQHLRAVEGRPFIGLETTDPQAVEWMGRRLHEAGYGLLNRIYVRICSGAFGNGLWE